MLTERCPHCAAALPAAAEWCGQCWADLRPAPPASAPPTPAPPAPAPPAPAPPTPAPPAALAGAPELSAAPTTAARSPVGAVAWAAAPGWPCGSCAAVNDVAAAACTACGTPFLAGAEAAGVYVPGFGRVGVLPRRQKLLLMTGVFGGVGAALTVLLFVAGLVL